VPWLNTGSSSRRKAYAALRRAITAMDIYHHQQEIRLDERPAARFDLPNSRDYHRHPSGMRRESGSY
jgi:hypothetical protein